MRSPQKVVFNANGVAVLLLAQQPDSPRWMLAPFASQWGWQPSSQNNHCRAVAL